MYSTAPADWVIKAIQAIAGITAVCSIMVDGVLTCLLLRSMHDLKATQMNVQYSLIQEFIFYGFEMVYKVIEATKEITVVVSIVVVGALTCCALIHSVYDLKAKKTFVMRKMKVQLITVQ